MFLKKIDEHLAQAISEAKFVKASKLEKKSISRIKSGTDFVCCSPWSQGKTTSIVLAVIQQLKSALDDVPRAVIIVRDIESAHAMLEMFEKFAEDTDLRIFCTEEKGKLDDLRDRVYFGCDVLISVPKRFNQLYHHSGVNLNSLKMLLIDDSEFLMRQTIHSQLNQMVGSMPECQIGVFTVKMNERVERFMESFMKFPQVDIFDEQEEFIIEENDGEIIEE